MSEICITEEKLKKKRGRKPSKERKGYFYEEQEKAVADYILTDDEKKKNEIFNTILKPAFTKMIESIIRRYNLYPPDEEFQETFDDTISGINILKINIRRILNKHIFIRHVSCCCC
jgi:uncharacterized membrane protein YheB (UPF0754 family)